MASLINPLFPAEGDTATSEQRANFSAAKDEIEALQTGKSATTHNHDGTYEPVITPKNTGFNKAFGTGVGTVSQGNHNHTGVYEPVIVTKNDAFNKSFGAGATDVATGNHTHSNADNHIADATIHFTQASISITESQVSDLQDYVVGPASAVGDNFASYNLTTGKLIKDSGSNASSFDPAGSASTVDGNLTTHAALNSHMTSDERGAMTAANSPSGLNPLITQDDFVSGGGHAVKHDNGTAFTQRANLNFVGATVSDDSGNNATTVTITGGGGGEANTASNSGGGEGLSQTKNGVDLPFKSLLGGTNVSLTSQTDTVTIVGQSYGSSGSTMCEGNDARLSDARTPTAHNHTESDITDLGNYVPSVQEAAVGTLIANMLQVTQAQYDGLTPNSSTLYYIVG